MSRARGAGAHQLPPATTGWQRTQQRPTGFTAAPRQQFPQARQEGPLRPPLPRSPSLPTREELHARKKFQRNKGGHPTYARHEVLEDVTLEDALHASGHHPAPPPRWTPYAAGTMPLAVGTKPLAAGRAPPPRRPGAAVAPSPPLPTDAAAPPPPTAASTAADGWRRQPRPAAFVPAAERAARVGWWGRRSKKRPRRAQERGPEAVAAAEAVAVVVVGAGAAAAEAVATVTGEDVPPPARPAAGEATADRAMATTARRRRGGAAAPNAMATTMGAGGTHHKGATGRGVEERDGWHAVRRGGRGERDGGVEGRGVGSRVTARQALRGESNTGGRQRKEPRVRAPRPRRTSSGGAVATRDGPPPAGNTTRRRWRGSVMAGSGVRSMRVPSATTQASSPMGPEATWLWEGESRGQSLAARESIGRTVYSVQLRSVGLPAVPSTAPRRGWRAQQSGRSTV